jgi:hypothetical protein
LIPLIENGSWDRLLWHFTKHGYYTVSSGYKVAMEMANLSLPSTSNPSSDWMLIWGCRIPQCIKVFAWLLCHQALATRCNLVKRGINSTLDYSGCCHLVEDDLHLFLYCEFSRRTWYETKFYSLRMVHQATYWLHLFQLLMDNYSQPATVLEKSIMYLWEVWKARNAIIFSSKIPRPGDVVASELEYLHIFQEYSDDGMDTQRQQGIISSSWQAPTMALAHGAHGCDFGFVLGDDRGRVLRSGAGPCCVFYHLNM